MQRLRQLSAAAVLICALTYTTFAGDMNYPVTPPPPPPDEITATTESPISSESTSGDIIEAILWNALQGIVSVL